PSKMIVHPVSVIARNGRKMSGIIEALMLLSAVRQADVEVTPINMQHLINETLDRLFDQIESSKAKINYATTWPTALAFAPWIEEVWYNYLGNALKYGGSPLEIELGATPQPDHDMILFWVQDNGAGIPEALNPELFRPFADYGRGRKTGAGLGLSIVQRIITRMNGMVGVESEPGKGSRFWFTLPAHTKKGLEA
ncbi:MAG: two-component system sensor histidine kinase/response regulator, partial [Candidatus Promineifilaceae bacterium]